MGGRKDQEISLSSLAVLLVAPPYRPPEKAKRICVLREETLQKVSQLLAAKESTSQKMPVFFFSLTNHFSVENRKQKLSFSYHLLTVAGRQRGYVTPITEICSKRLFKVTPVLICYVSAAWTGWDESQNKLNW